MVQHKTRPNTRKSPLVHQAAIGHCSHRLKPRELKSGASAGQPRFGHGHHRTGFNVHRWLPPVVRRCSRLHRRPQAGTNHRCGSKIFALGRRGVLHGLPHLGHVQHRQAARLTFEIGGSGLRHGRHQPVFDSAVGGVELVAAERVHQLTAAGAQRVGAHHGFHNQVVLSKLLHAPRRQQVRDVWHCAEIDPAFEKWRPHGGRRGRAVSAQRANRKHHRTALGIARYLAAVILQHKGRRRGDLTHRATPRGAALAVAHHHHRHRALRIAVHQPHDVTVALRAAVGLAVDHRPTAPLLRQGDRTFAVHHQHAVGDARAHRRLCPGVHRAQGQHTRSKGFAPQAPRTHRTASQKINSGNFDKFQR